jgi:deazaflavin-dependent oxidoreductase (nitroreductase family)
MIPLVQRGSPTGFLRLLLRVPVWLYRAHLDWLLGARFLLLTHRGRTSGFARHTVLEVVQRDPANGIYFVASGWGEKSDWLRNIQATPEVTVHVSQRAFPATAKRLSVEAAQHVLFANAQRHPLAFRTLAAVLTGLGLKATPEGCRTLAQFVPVVALQPKQGTAHWPTRRWSSPTMPPTPSGVHGQMRERPRWHRCRSREEGAMTHVRTSGPRLRLRRSRATHRGQEIMELHHAKHHAGYVRGANTTLEQLEEVRRVTSPAYLSWCSTRGSTPTTCSTRTARPSSSTPYGGSGTGNDVGARFEAVRRLDLELASISK